MRGEVSGGTEVPHLEKVKQERVCHILPVAQVGDTQLGLFQLEAFLKTVVLVRHPQPGYQCGSDGLTIHSLKTLLWSIFLSKTL